VKKQLVIIGIIALLVCVGLCGCIQSDGDKAKEVGVNYLRKYIMISEPSWEENIIVEKMEDGTYYSGDDNMYHDFTNTWHVIIKKGGQSWGCYVTKEQNGEWRAY